MKSPINQPLAGRTVVVTRDAKGNRDLASRIETMGGRAIPIPVISLKPLTDAERFRDVVDRLGEFDWIVLTSPNGVSILMDYLQSHGLREGFPGPSRVACIGKGTAKRLAEFGIEADFVPDVFTSVELGQRLASMGQARGLRFALLRSALASDDLASILLDAGALVEVAELYDIERARPSEEHVSELCREIREGHVDWLVFASGSSAEAFFGMIDRNLVESSCVRIVSIGPMTSQKLRSLGLTVDVEAAEHTIDGLLNAMIGADT